MEKSRQKTSNAGAAGRMKHLRATKFETKGFGSGDPIPSLAKAGEMIRQTRAAYRAVPRLVVHAGGNGVT